jgi:hypothetical protein
MANVIQKQIDKFRGTLRVGRPALARRAEKGPGDDFTLSSDEEPTGSTKPSVLEDYKKMIPGEALAGYISLQPLAAAAKQPEMARVVLALIFCIVTFVLRWIGTQDKASRKPQLGAVALGTISFVLLVYATGGQIYWHTPVTDQEFYAQILAAALSLIGPPVYSHYSSR